MVIISADGFPIEKKDDLSDLLYRLDREIIGKEMILRGFDEKGKEIRIALTPIAHPSD